MGEEALRFFATHGHLSVALIRQKIADALSEGDEARALDLDNFLAEIERIAAANDDGLGT